MRSLLVISLFALSVVASAEDTGLLLGLSDREGNSSTVWIGRQGVATFARRAGDGYWLWKEGGFWHIVDEDLSRSGGRATVTVTDPKGDVRVIKGEEGRPDTDFHVMYVAPRGIGLMRMMNSESPQSGGGGFGGGGFGGGGGTVLPPGRTRSFPRAFRHHDWADLETALEIDAAFDEEIAEEFKRSAQNFASSEQVRNLFLDGDVSPTNWTLRRDQGAWALHGLMYSRIEVSARIMEQEFTVRRLNDPALGAHVIKGPSWSRIVSEYPDVIDFSVSPDGKMTIIVTPTDVFVHASSNSSLKKRLQRVRVPADRIVMTQWIGDSDVRKVAVAVTKIKR